MIDVSKKINIIGDIDEAAYLAFVEALDDAEEMLEGDDLYIELASHGGDALIALAFFDRIRKSKSNITITAYGSVMSAAVLILAAGDTRLMAPSAWVMVHEDSLVMGEEVKVTEIEKNAKLSRRLEDQWNKLMASRTKSTPSEWAKLHKEETYLDANECLALGLIDKIL